MEKSWIRVTLKAQKETAGDIAMDVGKMKREYN
jgi:hypothetical protein